ncbi:MAG: DUF4037 domain-containing protein [Nocardioides sp.]
MLEENGIGLARSYWVQIVRPLLDLELPSVPRIAARIGSGSDVLGLDDEMSRDHDWGLRLQLLVPSTQRSRVEDVLTQRLPAEFAGHPTRLQFTGQDSASLTVEVATLGSLIDSRLGFDPRVGGSALDWLSLTGQAVLEFTSGEVFEDSEGQLGTLRSALTWYPEDVWRYVVASGWQRLDQELPLMGRAGQRGDDLGSRVIAARLVDIALHLGFLACRRWAPYSKWRGTVFAQLPLPSQVTEHLANVLDAPTWPERAEQLLGAVELIADQQALAGLPTVAPVCTPFWDRPFLHLNPALAPALQDSISDPTVQALPIGLGSIEQRSDNVDLLVHAARRRAAVGTAGDGTGPA